MQLKMNQRNTMVRIVRITAMTTVIKIAIWPRIEIIIMLILTLDFDSANLDG